MSAAFRSHSGTHTGPTPRSRYNASFLAKLRDILHSNPEADLQQELLKYDQQRLEKLKGTRSPLVLKVKLQADLEWQGNAKRIKPISQLEQKVVHSLSDELPVPDGDLRIILPLSFQVKDLIGLESSYTSNTSPDLPFALWRLLREGKVLHRVLSKWVVRISPTIVVKFAPALDISEMHTMYHVWRNRGALMPEPLGALSLGRYNYLFMTYVEGVALASLWAGLTPGLKTSVQVQLGEILRCLRKVPLPSGYLGSGDPPRCKDLRRHVRSSPGSISNEADFNKFLITTHRELNPVYLELCTSEIGANHQIVMTHSDIRLDNILVSQPTTDTIKITGLVDWELSGAYPEYWEYVKALNGVNYDLSDWFSYLPTDVIGKHPDAWRQDSFISRLVL